MTTIQMPEAAIFDMDGTLFKTETLLLPAYHRTFEQLRQEGLYEGDTPPEERILSGLGMLLEEIWEKVIPGTSASCRRRADELLLEYQRQGLREGVGELYEGVQETLEELKRRGVRLFVASNGLEAYVKEVAQYQGIAPLFEGLYSAGEYRTSSKVDLVRILKEQHGVASGWMVGDRSSDVEAGKENGLLVVGCDYASFGKPEELSGADIRITAFKELLTIDNPGRR
ncbi:HAD family hydrolase [Paenibacillus turpanensis]|uniref:HAD family hydrolase n=1 Tax=Paenibacillus turpanensis TaxID=2689078 RepID=UPI00140C7CD3|nr:HAD hydrolase-like protein [Paenibacillus turpanensis]